MNYKDVSEGFNIIMIIAIIIMIIVDLDIFYEY